MKQHAMTCVTVLSLMLPWVALGDEPSFADLLARAHQQVAEGHHITPQGDNVTETFEVMLNRLHSATPEQVNEFLAMLHDEQKHALAGLDRAVGEATAKKQGAPELPLETPEHPSVPSVSVATSVAPRVVPATPIEHGTLIQTAPALPAQAVPKPTALAKEFFAKGQAAEDQGNISGARRYYQIAAEGNHAEAAFALGRLYEPSYLRSKAVGGIDPDPAMAKYWYDRASQLRASAPAPPPPAKDAIAGR